ncbi:hypothetical protein Tco_1400072 [Tanacetum coccineum]
MGSGYKKIHVCINNCLLYWKDDKDLNACRTYGISIWRVDNKTQKVYENIRAKRITDGVLRHPTDSQAWRTIDEKFPKIAKDPRNLRLGFKDWVSGRHLKEAIKFGLTFIAIMIIMTNLPPPNHVTDLPKDDPEKQPELAPEPGHLNGFALHQNPQPRVNEWMDTQDDEEEEEEEDPEMEEEMEEENHDDDAEVINPYEEVDPLNLPPPDSDTESEDTAVDPI